MSGFSSREKCIFEESTNKDIIQQLKQIEKKIIQYACTEQKDAIFRIEEQLNHNFIKIFTDNNIEYGKNRNIDIVLKISGIWNNYNSCGLTFRFYIINRRLNIW